MTKKIPGNKLNSNPLRRKIVNKFCKKHVGEKMEAERTGEELRLYLVKKDSKCTIKWNNVFNEIHAFYLNNREEEIRPISKATRACLTYDSKGNYVKYDFSWDKYPETYYKLFSRLARWEMASNYYKKRLNDYNNSVDSLENYAILSREIEEEYARCLQSYNDDETKMENSCKL